MVNKKQQDKNYSFRQRRNETPSSSSTNSTNKKDHQKKSKVSKSKTKAAPLSKYRRKTANARERTRMREINTAFENLRKCVPSIYSNFYISTSSSSSADDQQQSNEKLTKITTLRLAMMYIRKLSHAINNNECHTINLGENEYSNQMNTKPQNCDNNDQPAVKVKGNKKQETKIDKPLPSAKSKISVDKPKQLKIGKRQKRRNVINSFEEHNYSDFMSSPHHLESDGESLNLSEEGSSSAQMHRKNNCKSDSSVSCSSSSCSLLEEPLDLIMPRILNESTNKTTANMNEITDFSAPFFSPIMDLDLDDNVMNPFTDLFSDLVSESTLDYLI